MACLRKGIDAEEYQVLPAQEQIRTLTLFKELIELNQDHSEQVKAMLPRFVDYAVWREEEGERSLEIAPFPKSYFMSIFAP